jgi:signal transduction histidine kinase
VNHLDLSNNSINPRHRIIGSAAMIAIYVEQHRNQNLSIIASYAFVVLLYLILFWTPSRWWNELKYSLITTLIIIVTLILHYTYGISSSDLLWPMVGFLATIYGENNRLSIILTTITIAIATLVTYKYPFPIGEFLFLVGLYLGIRSRRIQKEAYRLSHLHLKELNEAHHELQGAYAKLQEATVHSMRYAALEERARLAREIHDGIGHQLTSLIIQLQAVEIMLPKHPEDAANAISQTLNIARRAMTEVRLAVKEWKSDEMGLGLVALKGLISQVQGSSKLKINFVQDSDISEWPIQTSIVLYRLLQESLTNILRHSQATLANIHIKETHDTVILTIVDNGNYTGDSPLTPGFGLKGILERCRLSGGDCVFSAESPHGFRIQATLPIEPETIKQEPIEPDRQDNMSMSEL